MKEFIGELMINPIIPIWLMAIICIVLLCFKHKGIPGYIRQIVIVILLFAINLRIMVPDGTQEVKKENMNAYVLFAVDNTISMLAGDCGELTRFAAAKGDCLDIIDEFESAHFGVVTFDDKGKIDMPFTTDAISAKNMIKAIYPKRQDIAKGTSIGEARTPILDMLERAKQSIANGGIDEGGKIILIFVSDGEITKKNAELPSFKEIADYVDGGAVCGYGTEEGGKMYYYDSFFGRQQLVEYNMKPAISHYDEDNMQKLAKDMGIEYMHMTSEEDTLELIESLKADMISVSSDDDVITGYADTYFYFVIPVMLLLAWEYISYKRKRV